MLGPRCPGVTGEVCCVFARPPTSSPRKTDFQVGSVPYEPSRGERTPDHLSPPLLETTVLLPHKLVLTAQAPWPLLQTKGAVLGKATPSLGQPAPNA